MFLCYILSSLSLYLSITNSIIINNENNLTYQCNARLLCSKTAVAKEFNVCTNLSSLIYCRISFDMRYWNAASPSKSHISCNKCVMRLQQNYIVRYARGIHQVQIFDRILRHVRQPWLFTDGKFRDSISMNRGDAIWFLSDTREYSCATREQIHKFKIPCSINSLFQLPVISRERTAA